MAKAIDLFSQSAAVEGIIPSSAGGYEYQFFPNAQVSPENAVVIQQVEYIFQPGYKASLANNDSFDLVLTFLKNRPSGGWSPLSEGILDFVRISRKDIGTVADLTYCEENRIVHDYSRLKSGGKICHPLHLFFETEADSTNPPVSSITVVCKIEYYLTKMTDEMMREFTEQLALRAQL